MTRSPNSVVGWKLPEQDREYLLQLFPPAYADVIADHVTGASGAGCSLPTATGGRVVGTADDGVGLQTLVVEIAGTTRRPDGSVYHITWSLDAAAGRKPVESNDLLRRKGWTPVAPVAIALEPARYG